MGAPAGRRRTLTGAAASPGTVQGIARVVRGVEQIGDVREGEILVCGSTSPAWAPIFSKIRATVTDVGGVMSHAAIVCREYGLPAVVGTGRATSSDQDGSDDLRRWHGRARRDSRRRMSPVEFIDTSTRDGDQSLWSGTGLATADVLSIAPVIDRVGYHALDFTARARFIGVSVRFHQRGSRGRRIRLVSAAMPNTPSRMITSGMRFISWVPAGEDVMALAFRLVARNGIRRLQVVDPSNDPARLL